MKHKIKIPKLNYLQILFCIIFIFSFFLIGQKSAFASSSNFNLLFETNQAEQNVVTGTVTDGNSQPLPGVTVVVKGTTVGTVTNMEGNFRLGIPTDAQILVFSFVGMKTQEVAVAGRTMLTIVMEEDVIGMEEVIVVGYGTQKKANLTGAVSQISSEILENRPITSVAAGLQGTLPGLSVTRATGQPGNEELQFQIRGASSASGNANPLLVVDGTVSPLSALQTINSNDIESISILKDASAAGIYGAEAAGGVILVTTKMGKQGKTKYEYSNLVGASMAMNLPDRFSLLEEAEYSNMSQVNAGFNPEYSEKELEDIRNGVPYIVNPNNPEYYIHYNTKDHVKETLKKYDITQNHNFVASGGTDIVRFLASAGFYEQRGVFKVGPDGLKRYNARFNVETNLSKHFTLSTKLAYTLQKIEAPVNNANGAGVLFEIYKRRQRYPIWNPEGTLNGHGSMSTSYALMKEGGYMNTDRNIFEANVELRAKELIKGLNLRAVYGGRHQINQVRRFWRTVELWARLNPVRYLNSPNRYDVTNQNVTSNNLQFIADYSFQLESSTFRMMAGYQFREDRLDGTFSRAVNMINNNLPTLNLGDPTSKLATQSIGTSASKSIFGRFNYDYDSRLLFEFTFRNDESSRLAPGMRSKFFPSLSAGWNIHSENWFSNALPFVSAFKPRVSWGQMGSSVGIGNYTFMNLLTTGSNVVLGDPEAQNTYFYQSSTVSSSLTWETVQTINVGLDFGFAKNQIHGSFNYYIKNNNNMLTPLVLPSAFGIGTPKINNGELKTWGWEFDVNYNKRIKQVNFGFGFNLSDSQNELISYAGQNVIAPGFVPVLEGYPINSLWGYKADGYFQTQDEVDSGAFQDLRTGPGDVKYVDIDNDGRITPGEGKKEDHGDLVYLGTSDPRFLFGITGNMTWKGIDFSVFLQGVGKRLFYPNVTAVQPMRNRAEMANRIHLDYWTPENPNAAFPRPYVSDTHNFLASDKWVLDGKYIRLKNIQLGYTLPARWVERAKISKTRIFISGQDLLTFSALGPFDGYLNPESRSTGNWGADYPFFATVSMGLNISF